MSAPFTLQNGVININSWWINYTTKNDLFFHFLPYSDALKSAQPGAPSDLWLNWGLGVGCIKMVRSLHVVLWKCCSWAYLKTAGVKTCLRDCHARENWPVTTSILASISSLLTLRGSISSFKTGRSVAEEISSDRVPFWGEPNIHEPLSPIVL